MLIVLEGPPKSGKTTLAKSIAYMAGRELLRIRVGDPLPWAQAGGITLPNVAGVRDSIYLLDNEQALTTGDLDWLKRQSASGADVIVTTRYPLPDFTTPSYILGALPLGARAR